MRFMPSTSEMLEVAKEKGMTLTNFASRFGVTDGTARRWLKSIGMENFFSRNRKKAS